MVWAFAANPEQIIKYHHISLLNTINSQLIFLLQCCFVAIEFQAIFCNILHSRSLHCWYAVATSRHGFPFLTAKNLGAS